MFWACLFLCSCSFSKFSRLCIPSGKIVPDISYLCIKRENNGTGETESFVIILEHGKGYLGF